MKLLRLGISTLAAVMTTSCTFANTAKTIQVVDPRTGDSILIFKKMQGVSLHLSLCFYKLNPFRYSNMIVD